MTVFVRGMLAVWITLVVGCAAGVALGRADSNPTALQRLGLTLCGGEACFRGIRVGTDWQTVRRLVPEAVERFGSYELPLRADTLRNVRIGVEVPGVNVQFVKIESADVAQPLRLSSITAGAIVAQYGAPCRLYLTYVGVNPFQMTLIYPTLSVSAYLIPDSPSGSVGFRLRPDSPLGNFSITKLTYYGDCEHVVPAIGGVWHGFTSSEVYRALFQRMSSAEESQDVGK